MANLDGSRRALGCGEGGLMSIVLGGMHTLRRIKGRKPENGWVKATVLLQKAEGDLNVAQNLIDTSWGSHHPPTQGGRRLNIR